MQYWPGTGKRSTTPHSLGNWGVFVNYQIGKTTSAIAAGTVTNLPTGIWTNWPLIVKWTEGTKSTSIKLKVWFYVDI